MACLDVLLLIISWIQYSCYWSYPVLVLNSWEASLLVWEHHRLTRECILPSPLRHTHHLVLSQNKEELKTKGMQLRNYGTYIRHSVIVICLNSTHYCQVKAYVDIGLSLSLHDFTWTTAHSFMGPDLFAFILIPSLKTLLELSEANKLNITLT